MKKISIAIFAFVLSILSVQVFAAEEIILYSKDGFEIKSTAVVTDSNERVSLAKNSDLVVKFTDETIDFAYDEPSISFSIKKIDGTLVRSLGSPSQKMSGDSPDLEKYLSDNKEYFEQVRVDAQSVLVKTPLDFESGDYILSLNINTENGQKDLEYKFTVSKSVYSFSDFDITLEDSNFLANILYASTVDAPQEHTIIISLLQDNVEVFKKEIKKTLYQEGSILIDEKIDNLENLKGDFIFKVEVKDSNETIFEKSQIINLGKSPNWYQYMYYGIILILLTLVFFVFRKIKILKLKIPTVVLLILFIGLSMQRVYAVEKCKGVDKPADSCVEDKMMTHLCKLTYSCDVEDARLKKYFSSGNTLNLQSGSEWVGPVSVSVNVCTNISQTLDSGNAFYVISDSDGSAWERKRYHIFKFTKGTSETVTFDPGGEKRNVNYATYNGGCNVTVYGRYTGRSSEFKTAETKIVEVGKITANVCKSQAVTEDVFETNSGLLSREVCTKGELRDTFIAGSVYLDPQYSSSSWQDKTVNVCGYLGFTPTTIPAGKAFYALTEQTSSWTMIDYPVFKFEFGTPKTQVYGYGTGLTSEWFDKNSYRYNAYKENVPTMKYDGSCNVTFRLYNRGEDTDSWQSGYKLIELGMVEDATCRDEHIVQTTTDTFDGAYKWGGRGLSNGEVEQWSKRDGGKYATIVPFFRKLQACSSITSCSVSGTWIRSYTDTDCKVNGTCGATNNVCTLGTLQDINDLDPNHLWNCLGKGGGTNDSCSVPMKINGVCDETEPDACTAGDYFNLPNEGTLSRWRCNGIGGGNDSRVCTFDLTTIPKFSVSCDAPNVVFPDKIGTITATPINEDGAVSYQWQDSNGDDIVGKTGNTYTQTFTAPGSTWFNIKATNQGVTKTNSCVVTARCDGTHDEGDLKIACNSNNKKEVYTCTSAGWTGKEVGSCTTVVVPPVVTVPGTEPVVTSFAFSPDTVGAPEDKCGLTLVASNVASCTLISPTGNISIPVSGSVINLTKSFDTPVPIGRYTLSCTGPGTPSVTKQFGIKSCSLNPDFRER